jgi:hypothetical protein
MAGASCQFAERPRYRGFMIRRRSLAPLPRKQTNDRYGAWNIKWPYLEKSDTYLGVTAKNM